MNKADGASNSLVLRIVLPILLIAAFIFAKYWIENQPKTVKTRPKPKAEALSIDTLTVKAKPYTIQLESYGRITPQHETKLSAEISAKVIAINPNFEAGRRFDKDEILLQLDDTDQQANLAIAQAELAQAQAAYEEERAKGKQAQQDWRQLHGNRPAPLVALRKPQLASAKAAIARAEARIQQAESTLAKTVIKAPYAGTVIERAIGLGELANPSTLLGTIFNHEILEVRLPISLNDARFIDWHQPSNRVDFYSKQGQRILVGELVGSTQVIETETQQRHLIARLKPSTPQPNIPQSNNETPIPIGAFVTALISGKTLAAAIAIPTTALYQNRLVYLMDSQSRLQRQAVKLLWFNEEHAIIASGLQVGDKVITTPLGNLPTGTQLKENKLTEPGQTQEQTKGQAQKLGNGKENS